jgi:hypothetical protein
MARKREGDDWEPAVGSVDPGEEVRVYVSETRDGHRHAVALPASVRRLTGERLEVVETLQDHARQIEFLRGRLDEVVPIARELGVSWAAIGFSVGLTGEAARLRWGGGDE